LFKAAITEIGKKGVFVKTLKQYLHFLTHYDKVLYNTLPEHDWSPGAAIMYS
jgi:hypothetical protein